MMTTDYLSLNIRSVGNCHTNGFRRTTKCILEVTIYNSTATDIVDTQIRTHMWPVHSDLTTINLTILLAKQTVDRAHTITAQAREPHHALQSRNFCRLLYNLHNHPNTSYTGPVGPPLFLSHLRLPELVKQPLLVTTQSSIASVYHFTSVWRNAMSFAIFSVLFFTVAGNILTWLFRLRWPAPTLSWTMITKHWVSEEQLHDTFRRL